MREGQKRWLLPCLTLMMIAGILLGRMMDSWVYPAGGAVLALVGTAFVSGKKRSWGAGVLVLCLCVCLGQRAYHPTLPVLGDHWVEGVVSEEIRTGEKGQNKTLLRSLRFDGQPYGGGGYWSFYASELPEDLVPGATVRMKASVYQPASADNPGGFDFREYLLQQGVTVGVYGCQELSVRHDRFDLMGEAAALRQRLTRGLQQNLGPEAGGYAATMLLGAKDLVEDGDRAAFSTLGIAHVLSVSGYHVGVLVLLIFGLLKLLHCPRRWRILVLAPVLCGYALLTGLHAPVVRASLLVLLSEVGVLRHRKRVSLHLLCASACLILLINPTQLTGASFQLTYGALLGLTLVTPRLSRLLMPVTKIGKWLHQGLSAGLGAQIGLLFPELFWFQELPILGLLMNLVAMVVSQVVLTTYWLALALLPVPVVGPMVGQAAAWLTSGMVWLVRLGGSQQWMLLWTSQANVLTFIGCLLLLLGLSFLWKAGRGKRLITAAVGLLMTVVSVMPMPHFGVDYLQLSVGNADAAVLHDQGTVCVIDTGENGRTLASYLHQRRMSIDVLLITHLHTDHLGGVADLLAEGIPIKQCYLPAEAEANDVSPAMLKLLIQLGESGTEIRYLSRWDELQLPTAKLTTLWPVMGTIRGEQDANMYSLVLRADIWDTTMLLTGDLDGRYEMYSAVPADILKAAHHGSKSSMSEAYLEAVSPQAILLSCGDDQRLASMQKRAKETPLYATRDRGALAIRFMKDGFSITPYLSTKNR